MKSIWVVEHGEYSDYRVVGVFSSEQNAQRVADFLNTSEYGDDCTVAEWTLDPAIASSHLGFKNAPRIAGKTETIW